MLSAIKDKALDGKVEANDGCNAIPLLKISYQEPTGEGHESVCFANENECQGVSIS